VLWDAERKAEYGVNLTIALGGMAVSGEAGRSNFVTESPSLSSALCPYVHTHAAYLDLQILAGNEKVD
jgi:hypothetical protein